MAGYGSAANPISRDPWEYIVGVHWGDKALPAPGANNPPSPDAMANVHPLFSDFESDFGGAWTLIVHYDFASQFVQLPIVYFPGSSCFSINAGGDYAIQLVASYMSDDPMTGRTPCQCAILDAQTFAPLAVSPVTNGDNFCELPPAPVPGGGISVVPAFRVVGMGPSMSAVVTWLAQWWHP